MSMNWTEKDFKKAELWDKIEKLNEQEAAALWAGVWPDEASKYDTDSDTDGLVEAAHKLITQERQKGGITADSEGRGEDILLGGYTHSVLFYKRDDLIKLAESHNNFPPTLFIEKREQRSTNASSAPEYMNQKHPCFSPELEAANSAWTALFQHGDYRDNRAPKKQIKDWIRKNRPQITSMAAIERIAIICNPEKLSKGGAPKTE